MPITTVHPGIVRTVGSIVLLTRSSKQTRRFIAFVTALVFTITCVAQESSQPSSADSTPGTPTTAAAPGSITVPSGTRFPLVLIYPISTKTTHSGDNFHVQTTAPITVGNQVAIPAGTFIQGTVDKLSRRGDRAELRLRSAQLIFPGGYVTPITGPANVVGSEASAWASPSGATQAGAILAPMAGAGIGAAIGSAAHTTQSSTLGGQTITSSTPKGIAIGSMAGLAAGAIISFALVLHNRQFYVAEGAPMEMTLQQPLILQENEVARARWAAEDRPPQIPAPSPPTPQVPSSSSPAPTSHGTCVTPGTPGTPPTVIPGVPGPNGVPGPPTIIPGTPPTPGTPYPCP